MRGTGVRGVLPGGHDLRPRHRHLPAIAGSHRCWAFCPDAVRRGYCWWDVDHAGWVVTLDSPERQDFYGKTLEEALAWCLVWLMAPELGVGPFLI
jgi:hypothetical protein